MNRLLILASASPRRRELMQQIGLEFTVHTADIDETAHSGEEHIGYTLRLAEAKARTVLARHPDAVVIGADTIVTVDGLLLGKPCSQEDAVMMLRRLQGRSHHVTTGLAVVSAQGSRVHAETTAVHFVPMSEDEVRAYVTTGEPMDKAGAYAIQGRAARWIDRIEGDYSNVVGLPLARLTTLLNDLNRP